MPRGSALTRGPGCPPVAGSPWSVGHCCAPLHHRDPRDGCPRPCSRAQNFRLDAHQPACHGAAGAHHSSAARAAAAVCYRLNPRGGGQALVAAARRKEGARGDCGAGPGSDASPVLDAALAALHHTRDVLRSALRRPRGEQSRGVAGGGRGAAHAPHPAVHHTGQHARGQIHVAVAVAAGRQSHLPALQSGLDPESRWVKNEER